MAASKYKLVFRPKEENKRHSFLRSRNLRLRRTCSNKIAGTGRLLTSLSVIRVLLGSNSIYRTPQPVDIDLRNEGKCHEYSSQTRNELQPYELVRQTDTVSGCVVHQ